MTKETRKEYKGLKIVGKPLTNIEGCSGVIHKMKKDETLTIIFDDDPSVKSEGWLLEEVIFV